MLWCTAVHSLFGRWWSISVHKLWSTGSCSQSCKFFHTSSRKRLSILFRRMFCTQFHSWSGTPGHTQWCTAAHNQWWGWGSTLPGNCKCILVLNPDFFPSCLQMLGLQGLLRRVQTELQAEKQKTRFFVVVIIEKYFFWCFPPTHLPTSL